MGALSRGGTSSIRWREGRDRVPRVELGHSRPSILLGVVAASRIPRRGLTAISAIAVPSIVISENDVVAMAYSRYHACSGGASPDEGDVVGKVTGHHLTHGGAAEQ